MEKMKKRKIRMLHMGLDKLMALAPAREIKRLRR
jgi:hypothetical protein